MAREKIRLQFGKFNGDEHWGYDLEVLGNDEYGTWLGGRRGAHLSKPGTSIRAHDDFVVLIPTDDAWWVATFNKTPGGSSRTIDVYVDITTPTTINTGEAFTLDLDLDVIKGVDGSVDIDDEDEFAEHQKAMGYPPRVITAARETADNVRDMVADGVAPFDGSHRVWLAKL